MTNRPRAPRTLAVISAAPHQRWQGRFWSHGPYVRELDVWADLFDHITIVGPLEEVSPPADAVPFAAHNITIRGVPPTGGDGLAVKARQVALVPLLTARIVAAMVRADAVHVRCPGNVGLLGVLLAPLCSRRLVAKYAGQWGPFPGEKWTVRLQRWVLASRWWRGPVTVYGEWPGQPDHVVPFFTSILYREQIPDGPLPRQRLTGTLRVLFVGRLTGPKNVATLVSALARVRRSGVDATLTVVGDGAERANLEQLAEALGVTASITFTGAVEVDDVLTHYRQSDTLVLASESEGWPKAIAEAMTHGLVCIGSDRGIVPQMLGSGRGLVVPPRDVEALAAAMARVAADPVAADAMGERARLWARRHSLEDLRAAVAAVLTEHWGTPVPCRRPVAVLHITDTLAAGGAERMTVNLANGLSRDGFDTHLCTTRRDGVLAREVHPDVRRLALERTRRVNDLRAVVRLARYCRAHHIDIIHAHGTSLFVAAAARPLIGRAVLVWHDHLGMPTATRRRRARLFRLAVHRADHVIAVTRTLQLWVQHEMGVPARKTSTMANFVNPAAPTAPAATLPGTAGARIVCVANLRPQKDHLTLVRAMAHVHRARPDAHAVLLGAAADPTVVRSVRAELTRLDLETSVSLLGERPDVAAVLAAGDVGVLSSRTEGFPLALLEYGTAGLPTVATDVGECRVILDDGAAGRVVAPGDPAALGAALVDLLADPAEAARLGEALRARVAREYSAGVILGQLEARYRSLLAERVR